MKKRPGAVITGKITCHHDNGVSTIGVPVDPDVPEGPVVPTDFPEVRLHGTVKPMIVPNVPKWADAVDGSRRALLEGTYLPREKTLRSQQGEFVVQVFDQGEPGGSRRRSPGTACRSGNVQLES